MTSGKFACYTLIWRALLFLLFFSFPPKGLSLSLRRNEERPNVASKRHRRQRRGRSCAQVLVYPSSAGKEE